jgi:ankyrin repeat protein
MSDEAINIKDHEGKTALHIASYWSYTEIVKLLLERMSDEAINSKTNNGYTALHLANFYNYTDIVELLLEKITLHFP